jgi:anti-sigma B factor antagonist
VIIIDKIFGEVVSISLSGSLIGEPDATKLRQAVYRLLGENRRKFVLDLDELKYINSMGLGALIASLTSVRNRGGDMCLARVRDKVEGILMITKLVKVFRVYETVEKAVESFNP